jgi:hypothetical protein
MTDDQKKEALHLALELRYHAQNNEMIDQYYTELGNLCNDTAKFIESLVDE